MNKPVALALAACAAICARGENLFPDGDFSRVKAIAGVAEANGGKVSVFQEEYTWNNCGKIEVVRAYTNKTDGTVVYSATALVGGNGKTLGIPVEPKGRYDFALEMRGDVKVSYLNVQVWDGAARKGSKMIKADINRVPVNKTWTRYKGSFVAPEGVSHAALTIGIWGSSKYPPVNVKVGDAIYFDNVTFEKAEDGFEALQARGERKAQPVPRVKAVASGETFSDFFVFERSRGCVDPAGDAPSVHVAAEDGAIVIDVSIADPKGISPGVAGVWSGDTLEVFFGPTCDNIDRKVTQLAWNPSGARFARPGGNDGWKILLNEVRGNEWKSRIRVPYGFLGFTRPPEKGESLAFNVCHSRKNAKEMRSWAKVAEAFAEVKSFGRIIIGSYADALANDWKVKEKCDGRDAYEKRVSELETARRQEELDRFRDRGFTVAVVPVDSDYSVPFVPRESFNPTEKIELTAAVNERVGLPVALLNLTDRAEEYVVRLETSTFDPDPNKPWADKQMNGRWGLKGFPEAQIVARHALRFKDTDADPVTLRLEPLPKMDEACAIHVPPKEASLAWFDFDTSDVAPGVYEGRLRVIPLGSASKCEQFKGVSYHNRMYSGKMQDVPVRLEVLPIELSKDPAQPFGFFQYAATEGHFQLMHEIGTRDHQVSPWSFVWAVGQDGNLDFSRPGKNVAKEGESVRRILAWAKARGYRPTFFVGFSAYRVFQGNFGARNDPARARRLWPQYLKGLKDAMNGWGVPDSDYAIEVWDEPSPQWFDEIRESLTVAKAALPGVRLLITLGAHTMSAEDMRRLDPYIDGWILWSHGYFSRKEHLDYVADAIARGKTVWHYTCSTSGRAPIYETYRLHPWFGWRHNLTGNQFFIFQCAIGGYGPFDFKMAASAGIAYRSFDSTMPSLRYMSMRRGVEDVKYLAKLKAVAGDVPEVRKFLADAPVRVVDTERHDKTAPDRMRAEAARLILKYTKDKQK